MLCWCFLWKLESETLDRSPDASTMLEPHPQPPPSPPRMCVRFSLAFVLRKKSSSESPTTIVEWHQTKPSSCFFFDFFLLLSSSPYVMIISKLLHTHLVTNKSGKRERDSFIASREANRNCFSVPQTHDDCAPRRLQHFDFVYREPKPRKRLSNSSQWNHTQTCSVIISCFVIPFS
jgi:hypothetical protein